MKKILLIASLFSCSAFADSMSVLTLNLWGQDSYDRIPTMAVKLNQPGSEKPDFVVMQEVVWYQMGSNWWDTGRFLGRLLGYHTKSYEELAIASRYPFQKWRTTKLQAKGEFQRYVVMGDFDVPKVGKVRVVNVHFAHREQDTEVRRAQFDETMDWVQRIQNEDPADVIQLAGDFNAEPHWNEMKNLYYWFERNLNFKDFNGKKKTWMPTSGNRLQPATQRIDLIYSYFKNEPLTFEKETILFDQMQPATERVHREKKTNGVWVSDHHGVMHTFKVE